MCFRDIVAKPTDLPALTGSDHPGQTVLLAGGTENAGQHHLEADLDPQRCFHPRPLCP